MALIRKSLLLNKAPVWLGLIILAYVKPSEHRPWEGFLRATRSTSGSLASCCLQAMYNRHLFCHSFLSASCKCFFCLISTSLGSKVELFKIVVSEDFLCYDDCLIHFPQNCAQNTKYNTQEKVRM